MTDPREHLLYPTPRSGPEDNFLPQPDPPTESTVLPEPQDHIIPPAIRVLMYRDLLPEAAPEPPEEPQEIPSDEAASTEATTAPVTEPAPEPPIEPPPFPTEADRPPASPRLPRKEVQSGGGVQEKKRSSKERPKEKSSAESRRNRTRAMSSDMSRERKEKNGHPDDIHSTGKRATEQGRELFRRSFMSGITANIGGTDEGAQGAAGVGGRSLHQAEQDSGRLTGSLVRSLAPWIFLIVGGAGVLFAVCLLIFVGLPEVESLLNADTIRSVVQEVNEEYSRQLEEIKQTPHDELRVEGTPPDWRAVLAVYTARNAQNMEEAGDINMTPEKREMLKTIFWDMNSLSYYTEPEQAESPAQLYAIQPTMVPWDPSVPTQPSVPTDPPDPSEPSDPSDPSEPSEPDEPVTLVIVMGGLTPDQAADLYGLTEDQRMHMNEILLPQNAMLLNEILWDIPYITGIVVDGWAYPLPEEGTITSYFGMRVHPITGEWVMHDGLDIGVDEGTPIFAVRSGTVTVATYNSSAGNHVEIDHGDGFGSIYMHMVSYIVSPGQEVTAGQVIGYVGSTGDSTGPHLHIGISYDGTYLDPQGYLVFQDPEETTETTAPAP